MGRRRNADAKGYTAGWYDYQNGCVCLSYWDGGTRRTEEIAFEWYFYLKSDDVKRLRATSFFSRVYDVRSKGKHSRVYVDPGYESRREIVEWLREKGIEPLEADVNPLMRFLTEHPVRFSEEPRVLFFDLETDPRGAGWDHIEKQRILSVSVRTWKDKRIHLRAKSDTAAGEKELIQALLGIIGEHDLIVAWNGSLFDELLLKARCKVHRLNPGWRIVNFLDMLQLFKHPYFGYGRDAEGEGVKTTFGLDAIGQALLGYGKVEGVPGHKMHDVWKNDPEKLREYNDRDVDIMVGLEEKYGYIAALTSISHVCNRFVSDWSIRLGYLSDSFVLRYGFEHDVHFVTKQRAFDDGWKAEQAEQYEGAYVMDPVVGLHEQVCDVDFASLYPNVVRSFNISPETKIGRGLHLKPDGHTCVAQNHVAFRTDVDGAFPAVMTLSMELRKEWKQRFMELEEAGQEGTIEWKRAKNRSDAYKVVGNGSAGALGSPFLRYYDRDCAEAITMTAKAITQLVIWYAGQCGITVIYSDTDSVFLLCSDDVARQFCADVASVIDEWVEECGGEPGYIRLDLDATYKRIVFVNKKRYAGRKSTDIEGKAPDVKGLELMRTDGCQYERDLQARVIDYLLDANDPSPKVAERIVLRWRDGLFNGDVGVEKLTFTKSVNKRLESYKQDLPQVRVAKKMLDDGREVYPGMKVPYLIVGKKDGKIDAVHVDDVGGGYDPAMYWRAVYPATMRVLDAAFPSVKWKRFLNYTPNQMEIF